MTLTYKCTNDSCCKKSEGEKCLILKIESVMDEKNIADIFCPRCGDQMKQVK